MPAIRLIGENMKPQAFDQYSPKILAAIAGLEDLLASRCIAIPKANAIGERFSGSVRRECLDQLLVLGVRHLFRVMKAYVEYYNFCRPHPGPGHRILAPEEVVPPPERLELIVVRPVLGGRHHHDSRAAA
jgi:transposase InsO family protein